VLRLFVALPAVLAVLAPSASQASIRPLPSPVQKQLKDGGFWQKGCPVGLSNLRLLTVTHRDFQGRDQTGQLIVNKTAARALESVFRQLHELRFPIRHMRLADAYGPVRDRPRDNDVSASFACRKAVPSPCPGAGGPRSRSNHADGLAVDLNPIENPYVGCGQTRDPRTMPYRDRSRHRRGMVTRRVIKAFASIGWGWGGAWTGNTKDYMHFSVNGH
jgi:hypothetical protein